MKKTKFGVLKNNYDQKLPNGRYSKTHEKLFIFFVVRNNISFSSV